MSINKFEREIFNLPIYICNEDDFYQKREKKWESYLKSHSESPLFDIVPFSKNQILNLGDYFKTKYGKWKYEQIVGWLKIYILGHQVRGELWFSDARRLKRDAKRRRFENRGKVFELDFCETEKSISIFEIINNEIKSILIKENLHGRYIDSESFQNVGQFIDWHSLIEESYS